MDLDKLKQEWQKDVFVKDVKDSMIKEMIANENKSAFARIKKKEKEALYVIPICVVSFVLLSTTIVADGGFGMFWVLLFIPIGALLWYWSYYLCGFLNKIDMSRMSVTEVTGYILKYKTYLVRHTIGATIFLPVYMGVWLYCYMFSSHMQETTNVSDFSDNFTVGFFIFYLLGVLILFFVIIWFRFFKDIRNIQDNLKRLEEFQKE